MVEPWLQREIENALHRQSWGDQGSFVLDMVVAILEHAGRGGTMEDTTEIWAKLLPKSTGGFVRANRITKESVLQAFVRAKILQRLPNARLARDVGTSATSPWQVFISSPVEGYEEYRRAAARALDGLHFHVIRSEVIGASSRSPREQCLRWARDCDTYILILVPRYGWGPPGESKSVTHLEYEEARQHNSHKILVYELDHAYTDQRQSAFAQQVKDFDKGHLRATVASPEELARHVEHDVPSDMQERARRTSSRGATGHHGD